MNLKSWNFAASSRLRCNGLQAQCDWVFLNHEVSVVWVSSTRCCKSKFCHGLFLLAEGVSWVGKFRFSKTWPRKLKSGFQGGCAAWKQSCNSIERCKAMISRLYDRSTMRGSARTCGSRHHGGYSSSHRENIAWCSIQQKNSGGDVAKKWGHGLMFRSRQR